MMSDGNQTMPLEGGYSMPVSGAGAGKTNPLAIVSLLAGMLGLALMCALLGPVSLVLGGVAVGLSAVARKQIGQRGQAGEGPARAGLILGIMAMALGTMEIMTLVILTAAGPTVADQINATVTARPLP
jgi:hypothetical protein